ncbi:ribonuclease [Jiella sp. KSK16Y-1]|uniref:Ribonuclease n=2 Tax=Jiella mangrovi TaxID=2821407 RepID=A0ABS4BLK2_9HYPH|nr:ribonuclease [Jiella mangrovi]
MLGLAVSALPTAAQEPLDGFVVARKACNATISIRNAASESGTVLEIDRAYDLLGENRVNGSHYYVLVPEAEPARRWVEKSCGDWVKLIARDEAFDRAGGNVANSPRDDTGVSGDAGEAGRRSDGAVSAGLQSGSQSGSTPSRDYVLAISWQPAFCETHRGKAECRTQTPGRFDADHFSLHGLWPQPRPNTYCGFSADERSAIQRTDWEDLDPVDVDDDTRQALAEAMPGSQSLLERHEWTKHGTCYGTSQDEYFDDSLAVLERINGSRVRELFAGAIGQTLTLDQIRAAFDESFGEGAGERVRVACSRGGRRLIVELTIGLVGEITENPDVSRLIAAARPTDGGCDEGLVDAVGFE